MSRIDTDRSRTFLPALLEQLVQAERAGPGAGELIETLCQQILLVAPDQPAALWALSRRRLAEGNNAAVEALVSRIVVANPGDVRATQDLALRIMIRGDAAAAEQRARNAVRLAPRDPQSHVVMGMVLTQSVKPYEAAVHYRHALELTSATGGRRDPILLANFALSLRMQGRIPEARALYQEAHVAAPAELQMLHDWARLEEADRQFAAAADLLRRAELIVPNHPTTRLLCAVLQRRQGDFEGALATLARDRGPPGADALLEQGQVLDRLGRPAAAFAAFDAARAAMRAAGKPAYDDATATSLATRLRRFFTADRVATLPRAHPRPEQPVPIFILGFPRSGTTLIEQTLTATADIAAGGELPLVTELINALPRLLDSPLRYPEALAELWLAEKSDGLDLLRDEYLRRARRFGIAPAPSLFTDKMPLNETHLGLIALLFPDAKLIHVVRHPLDVVLSVYSNQLTHGFHCAMSLDSAARHYALIHDLVSHYRAEVKPNILQVRYEDLVQQQDAQVRRLLDFVGVPFDPAHLQFHQNRRHAPTASYAQVKEPLYDRSVGRWRQYRAELAPVIPILAPAMQQLGYEYA